MERYYFPLLPIAETITKRMITTNKPADETAAVVKAPEMAAATVRVASTRIMIKRITIASGVFMMFMIVPVVLIAQSSNG